MKKGLWFLAEGILVVIGTFIISGMESNLWCFLLGGLLVIAALVMEWERIL